MGRYRSEAHRRLVSDVTALMEMRNVPSDDLTAIAFAIELINDRLSLLEARDGLGALDLLSAANADTTNKEGK